MALATFIGTPIAGALLLAANYRLLGDNGARRNAVVWGSVATVLLLALAFALPAGFPNLVLPIGYTAVMGKMAERFQGKVYNSHISAGGHKQSQWRATGIGIACLIAILVIFVAIVMILPENVLPQ